MTLCCTGDIAAPRSNQDVSHMKPTVRLSKLLLQILKPSHTFPVTVHDFNELPFLDRRCTTTTPAAVRLTPSTTPSWGSSRFCIGKSNGNHTIVHTRWYNWHPPDRCNRNRRMWYECIGRRWYGIPPTSRWRISAIVTTIRSMVFKQRIQWMGQTAFSCLCCRYHKCSILRCCASFSRSAFVSINLTMGGINSLLIYMRRNLFTAAEFNALTLVFLSRWALLFQHLSREIRFFVLNRFWIVWYVFAITTVSCLSWTHPHFLHACWR